MIQKHRGFFPEALIFYFILNNDLLSRKNGGNLSFQHQIFSEKLCLPHLSAYGKMVFISLPAYLFAGMLCRSCTNSSVHGIFPVSDVRSADVFQSAGKNHSSHDASLGFLPVSIIVVSSLKPRLGKKAHIDSLIGKLADIQPFIFHNRKS